MASLEELLAEEGFKKGMLTQGPNGSPASRAVSMPLYPRSEDSEIRGRRSSSDVFSRRSHSVLSGNGGVRGVNLRKSLLQRNSSVDIYDKELPEIKGLDVRSFNDSEEIEEFNEEFDGEYGSQESGGLRDWFFDKFKKKESYRQRYNNDLYEDGELRSRKVGNFQVKPSFKDDIEDSSGPVPALDESAIKAMVSILTGYMRRFFKDENFRVSIYRSCASCLGISGGKESHHKNVGVVANLKEAIRTIERVVKGSPSPQQLRKASLQLSVITGLSSTELKDGYTSGIPNSHLAACAHLYLSVIYKLQKKDRVSAKHLLQVFCDCPNPARTTLLPGLWDRLFLPHLSHLREWYVKEAESIKRIASRVKKMKLLEEVYNNILDMGTYQFAVYYKDWLVEETEAPELPSILVPPASFQGMSQEVSRSLGSDEVSSPSSSVSSQAIVSKKLYESVFRQPKKMENAGGMKDWEEEVKEEVGEEEEVEVEQLTVCKTSSESLMQGDEETGTYSLKSGIHMGGEHLQEDHNTCSPDHDASFNSGKKYWVGQCEHLMIYVINFRSCRQIDWTAKGSYCSSKLKIPEVKELKVKCEDMQSLPAVTGSIRALNLVSQAKENELTLKMLAQAALQPQVADFYNDVDTVSLKQTPHSPAYKIYQTNLSDASCVQSELKKTEIMSTNSDMNSLVLSPSTEPFGSFEDIDQGSFFSSIPKDFICPLTGQLFKDPVTLETGQTYERVAIKERFDQGNRTCPVTRRASESFSLPVTNFVLKRVIDGWKSERCRNLLFLATQIAGNVLNQDYKSKDESALFIIEQLLTGFSTEDQMENAKYLISLGGLQFLLRRLELGNLEEKTRVAALLLCCIKANGCCRSYLATNIGRTCVLELLQSKQVSARTNAVSLLIELICLNRRTEITSFVSGLQTESIVNTMHILLVYLQSSPPEERVLVAVLLLHFDLMVEPRRYSIYREEAVGSIIVALECCLSDKKAMPNSRRALLMLGGHFALSGEILTESWLLKQAGLYDSSGVASINYDDEVDETISEEEARQRGVWLKSVAMVLLGGGEGSFLETLSKCLGSENPELVRVCLTTVAWLSHALGSLALAEFELSVFSTLIFRLKESLVNSQQIEHRVLASLSLLNFSKISECRVLLMTFAEEMRNPLKSLVEVTWTAKHLYAATFGKRLESTVTQESASPLAVTHRLPLFGLLQLV